MILDGKALSKKILEEIKKEVPKLKKSYFIMKKIKISFYKAITFLSRAFSGNLKKGTV